MAEKTVYHGGGRARPHNPPVLNTRNKLSLPTVSTHRNIPKHLRNSTAHTLEDSSNYAKTIICEFTDFISVTEPQTEPITIAMYRTACCYITGLSEGEANSHFSPSAWLINLYINFLETLFFFSCLIRENWGLIFITMGKPRDGVRNRRPKISH